MNEDKFGILLPHHHLKCDGMLRQVRAKSNFIIIYYCDKCNREVNIIVSKSANEIKEERTFRNAQRQRYRDEQEIRGYQIFEELLMLIWKVKNG